jgi:hypothetical protein
MGELGRTGIQHQTFALNLPVTVVQRIRGRMIKVSFGLAPRVSTSSKSRLRRFVSGAIGFAVTFLHHWWHR